VIACLRAWQDDAYCRERLGLPGALGEIDRPASTWMAARWRWATRWGRAGCASCCTCCRPAPHGRQRGIATICIGGGLGGAMLVEAL
jgi:acetyl-CoA C-acetyltransferase